MTILSQKQSLPTEEEFTEKSPEQLALLFLSHFIDVPREELRTLEITQALSELIYKVAEETLDIVRNDEGRNRTLH